MTYFNDTALVFECEQHTNDIIDRINECYDLTIDYPENICNNFYRIMIDDLEMTGTAREITMYYLGMYRGLYLGWVSDKNRGVKDV